MTLVYEFTPTATPVRPRDEPPPIVVRAARDVVSVDVHPGQLDAPATAALASTITAAVDTGATVLITFGNPELHEPLSATADHAHRTATPAARVAGPGFIQLAAGDRPWLLDVVGRRISTVPAERRFLPPAAWTPVRTVTITAASVAATTASGERIVTYHTR